jgi:hypothetical protein
MELINRKCLDSKRNEKTNRRNNMKKLMIVLCAGILVVTMCRAANDGAGVTSFENDPSIIKGIALTRTTVITGDVNGVWNSLSITPNAVTTTKILNGAVTAEKIDPTVVTNVLAAGMTLPAVSGEAITNVSAANITPAGTLPALNGSALTALTAANITTAGTKKSGKVTVVSTISTTVFDFVSGICTQAVTTP